MLETIQRRLAGYHPPENPNVNNRASVLIPVFEDRGEVHLWLTRRSPHLRSHSGQVAFPGGKQDVSDANALHAALRESEEEIGLSAEQVEVIGKLDQIISRNFLLVTPFVGRVTETFFPHPNPTEIDQVFSVPLSFFTETQHHYSEEHWHGGVVYLVHHFDFEGFDIWGLTALLILRFLEVACDYHPDYPIHHPEAPSFMELTQRFREEHIREHWRMD